MIRKTKVQIQERIPKIIYQLHIQSETEQGSALSRAVLLNLGFTDNDLTSSILKGKPALELFNEDPSRLTQVRKLFDRLKLKGIKVQQRRLLPKDWLTLWKSQWKPAALTQKLDVVPVWYKDKYKPRRGCDFILMDTLLSFGTGLHETTRFMAQFIENKRGTFKSFLDIGTGTGILALIALKYGAQDVVGIDIGELSIEAALDNMQANQLYFKVLKADIKKYPSKKKYDFVAANLITEDLIGNAHKILSFVKEDGLLAVSGISLENLDKLRKAFSSLPLKCLKISKGKQWSGLLFSKDDVIESFIRSSGPGGQNVNKVATCVALLHRPTGIIIKCQKYRTQSQNRQEAWSLLRQELLEREEKQRLFRQAKREKIRRQNRKRSISAKERMLENKKKNTFKKQNRKKLKSWE